MTNFAFNSAQDSLAWPRCIDLHVLDISLILLEKHTMPDYELEDPFLKDIGSPYCPAGHKKPELLLRMERRVGTSGLSNATLSLYHSIWETALRGEEILPEPAVSWDIALFGRFKTKACSMTGIQEDSVACSLHIDIPGS